MARFEQDTDNELFRHYVAEGIKAITGNIANATGGSELSKSFSEVLTLSRTPPETRTSDEIIDAIWAQLQGVDYDD